MTNLVEAHKNESWTESNLVARKFGVKHNALVKIIENVLDDYPDLRGASESPKTNEKFYKEEREYRGTTFDAYIMNREFFSLVTMRMTSKRAREWQRIFNTAFYEMERALFISQKNPLDIEWSSTRLIGKSARAEETEAIKEFIDYATKQGSKNAKFYYKHITNCTYKALGLMAQKHPKLRDQMNIYQISELMLAERMAANKILEYMSLKRHYKDIYDSVKKDLIIFSNSIRMVGKDA